MRGTLDALGVGLADYGDGRGKELLEGFRYKVTRLVEPFGERAGKLECVGNFICLVLGQGDLESVDRLAFLGRAGNEDLSSVSRGSARVTQSEYLSGLTSSPDGDLPW